MTLPELTISGAGSRVLILHADDLGMSHSINRASFEALDQGVVTSASAMVTCPWFAEAACFARQRTGLDFGVHITLTSEWPDYQWRPILGSREVSSLVDADGYLRTEPHRHGLEGFFGAVFERSTDL